MPHELLAVQEVVLPEQPVEVAVGVGARLAVVVAWAREGRDGEVPVARTAHINSSKLLVPASVTSRSISRLEYF